MSISSGMVSLATKRPKAVTLVMVGVTGLMAALAALPSLWPDAFSMLHGVEVDTDPENMLAKDEPVRVFHDRMKEVFDLHDMIVVGVVMPEGAEQDSVFNVETLSNVHELTEYAKTLRGETIGRQDPEAGVIVKDIIAPSTVQIVTQVPGEAGTELDFPWLMERPPATAEEAEAVRDNAMRFPFLKGTLVSEDGEAVALYLPITAKDASYAISKRLQNKIAEMDGPEEYHITGLPVAEDTFGVEMFIQMAVSAPMAMLVIFILMLFFFRKLVLIVSPMIIAMVSVIFTMALLIITGNTIHIMSSMIPIFIMPIAVLDSVHILSEFFDRYQDTKDRVRTTKDVIATLFAPMLYTSLTSAAGFASLALTPIPPVQVFGVFVAIGVLMAWLLTMIFIPSYIMFIPERMLENFGMRRDDEQEAKPGWLGAVGRMTYKGAMAILLVTALAVGVAAYGISEIEVNDNPTKWFRQGHPIRVADRKLNEHFGGTYMAYLELRPTGEGAPEEAGGGAGYEALDPSAGSEDLGGGAGPGLPSGLGGDGGPGLPAGLGGEPAPEKEPAEEAPEEPELQVFKQPAVLRYMAGLQQHLATVTDKNGELLVGKSNSLVELTKTINRELHDGDPEYYAIPDSEQGVAQALIQYESSKRPDDLWHFVTKQDFRHATVWLQLKSGDNKDMTRVIEAVNEYVDQHPMEFELAGETVGIDKHWFGLTFINVVWQEKMVVGMLQAFLGSFLVVLLMMTLLFRSALWGLLSMVPLTVTIGLIYGVIGIIGKDYDMPVAVLSSLTLGLAIDFAIHFLARSRTIRAHYGNWRDAVPHVFGEPARAIFRNIIVIAVGFLPLLAAPLVPYNTVGVLLAAILFVSGAATLLILPALMRYLEGMLFPATEKRAFACKCGTCVVSSVAAIGLIAVNAYQFLAVGLTQLTWWSLGALAVLAAICFISSRRQSCRTPEELEPATSKSEGGAS